MSLFSIVIPVFNKANYVAQTLQSVLDQSYTDFEIILVNDGSTDESLAIIEQFKDSRIVIINQVNQGLSAARNTGINAATGRMIVLLDADDLWESNHLKAIASLEKRFPDAKLFGAGYIELYTNGRAVKPEISLKHTEKPLLLPDFFNCNMHQSLVVPSAFAFKKEIIPKIGDFDTTVTYAEDVDFYIRANLTYAFAYDPEISCNYIADTENQITKSKRSLSQPPNFQKYLDQNPDHLSLKKYINLQQYFLALSYKLEKRPDLFNAIKTIIDPKVLTPKQRFLLCAPRGLVLFLKRLKYSLLKKGRRVTTF